MPHQHHQSSSLLITLASLKTISENGYLSAIGAYLIWGLLPIYWKQLQHIPALEILSHRIIWSFVFVLILLWLRGNWSWLPELRKPKTILTFLASTLLLSINWLVYIWAVNSNYIIETSLGYFINPLVNVLLGVLVLRESLNGLQWISVALAAAGVAYLTIEYGRLPWIALTLAICFGLYGLLRKQATLRSLPGLGVETAFVTLPALIFVSMQQATQQTFIQGIQPDLSLMIGAGVATSIPLILFANGAQRIPLSSLGILQYLAPSMQLAVGILIYNEPFNTGDLFGFALIWLGLVVYTYDRLRRNYLGRRAVAKA